MNFQKMIKHMGLAVLIGTSNLYSASPVTGNLKWMQSDAQQPKSPGTFESYPEINAWYTLPSEVKAFSFLDIYANTKDDYHGKTTLTKKIVGQVSGAAVWRYTNMPFSDLGVGLKLAIPVKDGYASLSALPTWFDKYGRREDKHIYGFSFGKYLGHGVNLESFGEMKNYSKGTKWSYGEVELTKKIGLVKVGASLALQPYGKSRPKPEFRAVVRYDWKLGGKSK